jgi:ABC-2 type transport system ATP-binding protein
MPEFFSIETEQLGRTYKIRSTKKEEKKDLVALQDVAIKVKKGELFGLLGPNGAGKTTLIKILTTLLAPTTGWARVAGFDVFKQADQVRRCINMVSGGEFSGYGLLTVRENLWMFSQFYGISTKVAYQRIDELLKIMDLKDRAETKNADLSTGLRQKMNIIRGFMTDPEVLFLDEPTLGLDVGASRDVRTFVRGWVDENPQRTLLLTTHYMVEADELCDRVAIINQGKVLACDTPARLKHNLQKDAIFHIQVSPLNGLNIDRFKNLEGVKNVGQHYEDGTIVLEFILNEEAVLTSVFNKLSTNNVQIISLQKHEPTLEDVFVNLVGRSIEEVEKSDAPTNE